jgi:hypothetical protein
MLLLNGAVSIETLGCSVKEWMIDECGEISGMTICRENLSTQWNTTPAPLDCPQISGDLIWD